jgi:hypothetical protein
MSGKANPLLCFILGTCYSQRIQPTPLLGVFLCWYDKGGWDGTGKGFVAGDRPALHQSRHRSSCPKIAVPGCQKMISFERNIWTVH